VAGLDEVGRGAWAGPVAAAAVTLPAARPGLARMLGMVRDSKMLDGDQRAVGEHHIRHLADVGLGWASVEEVDRLGMIAATRLAMERAVAGLSLRPQHLLIDHLSLPSAEIAQTSITFGDRLSLSIACASIVAKVARDRAMQQLDERFPGYGFARHKGYGTPEHQAALQALGPCPIHRVSFAPIAQRTLPGFDLRLLRAAPLAGS
jgi:ribonuclease HII